MPDSPFDANVAPATARRLAAFAAQAAPRDWRSDTASSTAASVDYVAQTVLAALAGLCGAGVAVRITPAWCEPLVLWQAMVGEPSTGKSSALAPMRRLLGAIEEERRALDDERRERHAVQATIQPDRLKEALRENDDALAARFLYAWPGAQPYRGLADLRIARDDEALEMLRRLARLAR